ncbi:MAG: cytochrome c-type biogenesis protein CcmH [Bryobacteraceae bacterium]|nr:cytochrome c-type biogenesis protein CcmH [Bryobacteraceae bacterium]
MRTLFLLILWTAAGWIQAAATPLTQTQQDRIHTLEESLMAPCCWAEPVSVHRSEIAMQMRMEIEQFVVQGQADREILDHYKGIYGARILTEPEGAAHWWVYFIPALAAAAGLVLVGLVIRRSRTRQTAGESA